MNMTKNVEITINIDIARKVLRAAGYDVDEWTDDEIFAKALKIVYGLTFQISD